MPIDQVPAGDLSCDLLVIGTGAGGLSAAVTASAQGLKVIAAEKERVVGGTTARSGGMIWVPRTRQAAEAGFADSEEEVTRYIRHHAGNHFNEELTRAFIQGGPEMVEFLENNSQVRFTIAPFAPDYYAETPGGKKAGRSLEPVHYSGEKLGKQIGILRDTLPGASVFGLQVATNDLGLFLTATRNLSSFAYAARQIAGAFVDRALHGRSMNLKNGNGLIAALLVSALDRQVDILTGASATELLLEKDRVVGARIAYAGTKRVVRAKAGVVLATGGFPHDRARTQAVVPQSAQNPLLWSLIPTGNTGDGGNLAEGVGGSFNADVVSATALTAIIKTKEAEGLVGSFPIFFQRHSPGMISVLSNGQRFINEAVNYHEFCLGLMSAAERLDTEPTCFVVCDHRALRRYGLGRIKPFPMPFGNYLRSGELRTGQTIGELATNTGVDPDGLVETVERFNGHARAGSDPDFHRGEAAYDLSLGDPQAPWPNPNLGPIEKAPFYAVEVTVGALGAFAGLATNGSAQVLRNGGDTIEGLYAVGNDATNVVAGNYIGAGATIGPAMTFGYLAAKHAATALRPR